jgi:hypothetical protein
MYHIERALKNLREMVGDKARVEGYIREEFKVKEIAYFTSVDKDIPCHDLQIFQWKGTTIGASTTYHPTQEKQTSALLYIYSNMDEME